jgi:hypothetical protein
MVCKSSDMYLNKKGRPRIPFYPTVTRLPGATFRTRPCSKSGDSASIFFRPLNIIQPRDLPARVSLASLFVEALTRTSAKVKRCWGSDMYLNNRTRAMRNACTHPWLLYEQSSPSRRDLRFKTLSSMFDKTTWTGFYLHYVSLVIRMGHIWVQQPCTGFDAHDFLKLLVFNWLLQVILPQIAM